MLNFAPTLEKTFRERVRTSGLTNDEYLARLLEVDPADSNAFPTPPPTKAPLPETPEETKARVQALLVKWQAEDPSYVPSEPKTLAQLSAEWAVEYADMTDEEREAERLMQEDINFSLTTDRV